ncbi:glycosyl transferase [Paenibacillus pectinilyticus]|uniref:Glycosyl transferase n=1 Tax=Paenibacillus pectinilyticus TaxID=512399 RepID=A0A1C0ZSG9_9BACL|nr:glycosyltransferase [Paenibacillus pectinilyticus]OCT11016.1 glycosyl transferase [Paenibacillus pectinilyticus]
MNGKRNVVIYKDHLLSPSETFVRAQSEALQTFTPYYVGSREIKGLKLPNERVIVLNDQSVMGWGKETMYKLLGKSTGFMKKVAGIKPSLIHAHFGFGGVLALPLVKSLGVPLIVTFHGFDATVKDEYADFYTHKLYIRKRQELQRTGTLFIAVSDFIRSKMLEQGYPEERVVRHYIGIDVDAFTPDDQVERYPIVLFVGRLVEKKGAEYLIDAMRKVQKWVPDCELVCIGDGPLRNHLEEKAGRLLKKYRFLGVQPPEVVREWMNKARVFSVPSVIASNGDAEGFGMVFAEANAMGLPVVSFATGGITEAVSHGETGFLVPEKDTNMLAAYIRTLLEEQHIWEVFSQQGKDRVRRLFNITKQNTELEALYEGIIQNNLPIKIS